MRRVRRHVLHALPAGQHVDTHVGVHVGLRATHVLQHAELRATLHVMPLPVIPVYKPVLPAAAVRSRAVRADSFLPISSKDQTLVFFPFF